MVGSKAWLESEDSQLRALFAELQPKVGEPETWDALAKRLPTHHNGEPYAVRTRKSAQNRALRLKLREKSFSLKIGPTQRATPHGLPCELRVPGMRALVLSAAIWGCDSLTDGSDDGSSDGSTDDAGLSSTVWALLVATGLVVTLVGIYAAYKEDDLDHNCKCGRRKKGDASQNKGDANCDVKDTQLATGKMEQGNAALRGFTVAKEDGNRRKPTEGVPPNPFALASVDAPLPEPALSA